MSLLRTAVRASVATRVVGNVQRKQQKRWAMEDAVAAQQAAAAAPPQPAPAPPPAPAPAPVAAAPVAPAPPAPAPAAAPVDMQTVIAQLTQLGQLRDAGVLTEAEFESQKQVLLAATRP